MLNLSWKRLTATGAVSWILVGLVSSVALILVRPQVWPGGPENVAFPLTFPALVSIPLGFFACWLGTVLAKAAPRKQEAFEQPRVRSQVGLGAEN